MDAIAKKWDKRIAAGEEQRGLVRVRAKTTKKPRAIVPIRMSQEEHAKITAAVDALRARGKKTNVSEFIRSAAIRAAQSEDRTMRIVLTYNQQSLDSEQIAEVVEAAFERPCRSRSGHRVGDRGRTG
jgi:hypothetical protein